MSVQRSSSERAQRKCPQCRDPFISAMDAEGYVECPDCGRVPASRKAFLAEARAALDAAAGKYPDILAS